MRRVCIVRAEGTQESTPKPTSASYFSAGKSYTAEEWKEAIASGAVKPDEVATPSASPISAASSSSSSNKVPSFGDIMAFSGPAPEIINSRLAMLGFVAAVGAELSSGEPVLKQLGDEPTLITLTFVLFAAASLVPLFNNKLPSSRSLGPFNAGAELINGRAAMLGIAALIGIEAVKGVPLF